MRRRICIALLAIALLAASSVPRAHSDADLALYPAWTNLFIGGPDAAVGQVVGVVPAGSGLGAFDITYTYDPALLDIDLAPGPMLGSTGRSTSCTPSQPAPNQARLVCSSSGAMPGAVGSGLLVLLTAHQLPGMTLRAEATSNLLAVFDTLPPTVSLIDTQGQTLTLSHTADVLITVRPLEGDVTGDCDVDIYDEQSILGRFGSVPGDGVYSSFYDLVPAVPDGQINAFDLQYVIDRVPSTCASPMPPQPPQTVNPEDADDDEISLGSDNCPNAYNPAQANSDGTNTSLGRAGQDSLGDACDADKDGDGYGAVQETGVTPPKSDLTYCAIMRADIDGDGVVSILDISSVATNFSQAVPPAPARQNQDGDTAISILDLAKQAAHFTGHVSDCA